MVVENATTGPSFAPISTRKVQLAAVLCASQMIFCACRDEEEPGGSDVAGRDAAVEMDRRDATAADSSPPKAGSGCRAEVFELDGSRNDFESLEGRVVDEEGQGVPNTSAQACGSNVCLASETDAEGKVLIRQIEELENLAFKYGDGRRWAQFALALDAGPNYDLGDQVTFSLPKAESEAPLGTGVSRSGGVKLTVADEATISFAPLTRAEDKVFAAASYSGSPLPEALARAKAEMVVFIAPAHAEICPPAELSVPNDIDLAPGTAVEFIYHNTDVFSRYAPYGGNAAVAKGHVSEDGKTILTDPTSGLPVLGAIGIRPR